MVKESLRWRTQQELRLGSRNVLGIFCDSKEARVSRGQEEVRGE